VNAWEDMIEDSNDPYSHMSDSQRHWLGHPRRRNPRKHDHRGREYVDPSRVNSTQEEAPYSYSEFFHFGNHAEIDMYKTEANYSDRLSQWNYDQYRSACAMLTGRFEHCGSQQVSDFLSHYFEKPVVAVAMAEGCNPSSGYPYFIFWHVDKADYDKVNEVAAKPKSPKKDT
jgi:hypothetical protein